MVLNWKNTVVIRMALLGAKLWIVHCKLSWMKIIYCLPYHLVDLGLVVQKAVNIIQD